MPENGYIKQRDKNLIKSIFDFLMNNFFSTNRKEVKFKGTLNGRFWVPIFFAKFGKYG